MKFDPGLILLNTVKAIASLLLMCTLFYCNKWDLDRTNPHDPKSENFYSLPLLTTKVLSDLASDSATITYEVTYDGGTPVVARGVCWTTSEYPTLTDNKTVDGTGSGRFSSKINGLQSGTTYYVRAYATNSTGTAYGNQITFITPVTDSEGNVYQTVAIGTQVWMAENLKVTLFNDGTPIPLIIDNGEWAGLSSPGYCWYNNDIVSFKALYGALYNWYAVDTASNGSRNICPAGWHVPSDTEWNVLTAYLGGEAVAGGKLKEAGTVHWQSPNTGATNESGFSAFPGGARNYNGWPDSMGTRGSFWSSTESSQSMAWSFLIFYNSSSLLRLDSDKRCGMSVRCIKD